MNTTRDHLRSLKETNNSKLILGLFVLLVIFFRFYNLNKTPGWFPDEGVDLSIAWNLLHGKMQLSAISYPFVPHPPLYFITSFPPLLLLGKSILAMRLTSAVFAAIGTYLVYLVARELSSSKSVAILSALLFVVFPISSINGRYGLSYELFLTISYACLYFSIKFLKQRSFKDLVLSATMAGLSAVTSYLGAIIVLLVLLLTLIKSKRDFLKVFLLSACPFLVYMLIMYLRFRENFIGDILYTFTRAEVTGDAVKSTSVLAQFGTALGSSPFYFFGVPGLFLLKNRFRYLAPAIFFALALFELKFKQTEFFFTIFVCIGLALLLVTAYKILIEKTNSLLPPKSRSVVLVIALVLITLPISLPVIEATKSIATGQWFGISQEKWFAPDSLADAQKVADFVNANTTSEDVVNTSVHFSSLIDSPTCDPTLATVYTGSSTTNFPSYFSPNRFQYNCSYQNAKFVVSDKFTEGWYAFQPNIRQIVLDRIWNNWPIALKAGEYTVFRNPDAIVVGNQTDQINKSILGSNSLEILSNIKLDLGLQKLIAYKDKLASNELSEIKRLFKVTSENDNTVTIETGNNIQKVYISQAPIVFHSANDRNLYKNIRLSGIDPTKRLLIDLSTPVDNYSVNLKDLSALPNLFLDSSSQDDLINVMAIGESEKTRVVAESNGGWAVAPNFSQSHSDASLESKINGNLQVGLKVTSSDDYVIFARVYDAKQGRGKLAVSIDGTVLSQDIINNTQEGFYFKKIFEGNLTSGKHNLVFSNDSSGTNDIETIYLIKKNSFDESLTKVTDSIRSWSQTKISSQILNLDFNPADIKYDYNEKDADHINIKYSSDRATVIALPRASSPNYEARDQDNNTYMPIIVNDQYLGFVIPKTGQIDLNIVYKVNKTK